MRSNRGSIVIEGTIILPLILVAIVLQLEVIRRVWVGLILQLSSFDSVRNSALGFSETQGELTAKKLVEKTLPFVNAHDLLNSPVEIHRVGSVGKIVIKNHVKYPSFLFVNENGVKKRYFEVTQACSFPISF